MTRAHRQPETKLGLASPSNETSGGCLGGRNSRLARLGMAYAPMGFVDGMNIYEYVRSEPTSHTDPEGTWARWTGLVDPPEVVAVDKQLTNLNTWMDQVRWVVQAPAGIAQYRFTWQVRDREGNDVSTRAGTGQKLAFGEKNNSSEYYFFLENDQPFAVLNAGIGNSGESLRGASDRMRFWQNHGWRAREGIMNVVLEIRERDDCDVKGKRPYQDLHIYGENLNNVNHVYHQGPGSITSIPLANDGRTPGNWSDRRVIARFEAEVLWDGTRADQAGSYSISWNGPTGGGLKGGSLSPYPTEAL